MEVTLNTVQVANANENFASLEEITDLSYRYRFHLSVSKSTVATTQANRIIVRTYKTNPKNNVRLSLFEPSAQTLTIANQDTTTLAMDIQSRSLKALTDILRTRNECLTTNTYSLFDLVKKWNTGIGYRSLVSSIPGEVRNDIYLSETAIQQQELDEDRTVSQLSIDLLKRLHIDPAEAIQRTYTTNTGYETNNGISSYRTSTEITLEEEKIRASLLSINNTETNQAANTPPVAAYNVTDEDFITIEFDQIIPRQTVSTNDFFVMFSIYNTETNLVQEFVKLVHHSVNLSVYQRIQVAPFLDITQHSKTGLLAVTLKQQDVNGTGVKLYKTVYNSSTLDDNINQSLVGNYSLLYGESITVFLQNNSSGTILYRALAYNESGIEGTDFGSKVISVDNNYTENNSFVSLYTRNDRSGLAVYVTDIPDDISSVQLYKTNISTDPNNETLLTSFLVKGIGSNTAFTYLDSDVDQYKNYRYRCKLVDIKGQEYWSSAEHEVYYRKQTQDYAKINVTTPVVTPISTPESSVQCFDVKFNVSYVINNKLEDAVRQLLVSQNLIEYYSADINRERLHELLATLVELRNLQTNEKLFMGFVQNGTYAQSETKYGLLDKSSRYQYELTTFMRSPTTLLQSVVLSGSSTPRTSGKKTSPVYTYVPFNIDNPYGLREGTLPKNSGKEFVYQYGLDQLEYGDITGFSYVNVDLKTPTPSINNLRGFMFNSKLAELNWSVNGDQSHISHFIIRRQNVATGKVDMIGKAHGINLQNKYTFIDPIRYTETGVFRYIVTMQFFDMSLSPSYTSNEVVI